MSGARKKWTKAVKKEKREWLPILQPEQAEDMMKSVPKSKLITASKLAERQKISLTVARKVLAALAEEGKMEEVISHSTLKAYARPANYVEVQETVEAKKEEGKQQKKSGKK